MENTQQYKYQPKNKDELIDAIRKEIYEVQGTKDNPNWKANLNMIDTSLIKDMSELFSEKNYGLYKFNGDISQWDTSNVKTMFAMFYKSDFNQPINDWNTSKVEDMERMFQGSKFNQPLDKWNTGNVENMNWMFENTSFNQNISNWEIDKLSSMYNMFIYSPLDLNKPVTKDNFKEYVKEAINKNNIYSEAKKDYQEYKELREKTQTLENIINIVDELKNNPNQEIKELSEEYKKLFQVIEELKEKLSNISIKDKQINQQNNYKQPKPKM